MIYIIFACGCVLAKLYKSSSLLVFVTVMARTAVRHNYVAATLVTLTPRTWSVGIKLQPRKQDYAAEREEIAEAVCFMPN